MGYSSYSDATYNAFARSIVDAPVDDIFVNNKKHSISPDMSPKNLKVRECLDSTVHPNTIPICIFLDVTGSMGKIPDNLIRNKLGTIMQTLIDKGLKDCSVLFGAIGDHKSDFHPIQVGQFESGAEELIKWLTSIYLEGRGGNQNYESYTLAWLVAARHTVLDSMQKRNTKGYLFTIGDEAPWDTLESSRLKELFGYTQSEDVRAVQILKEAEMQYNIFHIHCADGSYSKDPDILNPWKKLLGERLIVLDDHEAVPETIAATVQIMNGIDIHNAVAGFDSSSAKSVSTALSTLVNTLPTKYNTPVINL